MDYDCVIFIKHNTNMNYLCTYNIMLCSCWYYAMFTSVVIYVQEELQEKHEKEIQSLEVCT